MKAVVRIGSLLVISICACSCVESPSTAGSPRLIPDIDSLMDIGALTRASINKESVLNGERSTGSYPATGAFSEELAVFSAIETMNRPVFRETYQKLIRPDGNSNLSVTEWLATDSSATVRSFRLFHHDSLPGVMKMEAHLRDDGYFFTKEERLMVTFDPWSGRPEHYHVTGRQRIAWMNADTYEVKATIIYKP